MTERVVMLADGEQVCRGMDIRPDDVNFGLIPFGHSYGLGNLVENALRYTNPGGRVTLTQYIVNGFDRNNACT